MRLILDFDDAVEDPASPRDIAEVISLVTRGHGDKVSWDLEGDEDDQDDVRAAYAQWEADREIDSDLG